MPHVSLVIFTINNLAYSFRENCGKLIRGILFFVVSNVDWVQQVLILLQLDSSFGDWGLRNIETALVYHRFYFRERNFKLCNQEVSAQRYLYMSFLVLH